MILTASTCAIKINLLKQRYFISGQGWSEIQVENVVHVKLLRFCSLWLQLFMCRFGVRIESWILEKVWKNSKSVECFFFKLQQMLNKLFFPVVKSHSISPVAKTFDHRMRSFVSLFCPYCTMVLYVCRKLGSCVL